MNQSFATLRLCVRNDLMQLTSVPNRISIYDTPAVDRLRAELKFEPRRLRALRTAYFKKFLGVEAALAELPADVRDEFAERVEFHPLAVAEVARFATRRRDEARAADAGRLLDRSRSSCGPAPAACRCACRRKLAARRRADSARPARWASPRACRRPRFWTRSCWPASGCRPKTAACGTSSSWEWASRFTTKQTFTKRSPPCSRPSCSITRRAAFSFPRSAFRTPWSAARGGFRR